MVARDTLRMTNNAFLGNDFRQNAAVAIVGISVLVESRDNFGDGPQGPNLECPFAATFSRQTDFESGISSGCIDFDAETILVDFC